MMPAAQREEMMGQLVAVTMANVSAGMQQHFGAAELAADPKAKTVFDRFVARQQQLTVEQRSEEHTSELQTLMRISYAVFCLKKKKERTYPKSLRNYPMT